MNKVWKYLNVAAIAIVLFCFASCQKNQNLSLKAHQATQTALADQEMDALVAKKDSHHKKKKKEKKKKKKKSRGKKSK